MNKQASLETFSLPPRQSESKNEGKIFFGSKKIDLFLDIPELTTLQKQIILESWEKLKTKKSLFGKIFYQKLFEIAPSIKKMFRNPYGMSDKFMTIINIMMDLTKDGKYKEAKRNLWKLGAKHASLGVLEGLQN